LPDPLRDLYRFQEKKFFSLSHSIRVFIFGQEVTPWLRGTVSVTYGNRESFNTCSLELANPHQIWQVTRDNAPLPPAPYKWRTGGEYDESKKRDIFDLKSNPYLSPYFNLDITSGIGEMKSQTPPNLHNPKGTPGAKATQERRWRLAIGDCIFSKHDPIRIFVKNPYANRDEWMEVFCGYVHSHPITTNWITGESNVRIEGICCRYMLTKMRVVQNANMAACDPQPIMDTGFYAEFKTASTWNASFAKTSLEETMRTLILGAPIDKANKDSEGVKNRQGFGNFNMGNMICYNPKIPGEQLLERWHLLTLFGVHKSAWPNVNQNLWLTTTNVDNLGEYTVPLSRGIGGPDSRYLHMFLPIGGTGASSLVQSLVDTNVPAQVTWTTRWEIIREFAANLDYQVLTSPSGDILVEFPQYGFSPTAYCNVRDAIPPEAPPKPPAPDEAFASRTMTDKSTGLANIFTFELHQKEETLNDEAEDFPTILGVTGSMANQNIEVAANPGKGAIGSGQVRAYVYSPVLVSRYGVIAEVHDVPFAGQDANESPEAISNRLAKLGLLEFTKRMANSSTLDTSVVYRPFLFPNRPVWFKRSHRMGLLNTVSHNWNVRQDAQTTISVGMLMAERQDGSFRLLTGSGNTPIDYQDLWGQDSSKPQPGHPNSAVRTGVTDPPQANATDTAGSPTAAKTNQGTPINVESVAAGPKVETLYPRLRDKCKRVIGLWNAAHPDDKIVVTSGYRSSGVQKGLWEDFLAGRGNPANPPGNSWHEWGLACDMFPSSAGSGIAKRMSAAQKAKAQEYASFVAANTASDTDGPLVWKGAHDPVHYEPSNGLWRLNLAKMQGLKNGAKDRGPEDYKAVWDDLDHTLLSLSITPEFGIKEPPAPNVSTPKTEPKGEKTSGEEATGMCTTRPNTEIDLQRLAPDPQGN
jgi:hypothetical protein